MLTCLTTLKHSNLWPTRFDKSFCSLRWSFFLSTPRLLRHARFLCSKINIEFLTSIVLCKIISFDITRSPMYRVVVLACLGFQMVSVFPNKIICLPIDGYVSIQASNIALTTQASSRFFFLVRRGFELLFSFFKDSCLCKGRHLILY